MIQGNDEVGEAQSTAVILGGKVSCQTGWALKQVKLS